MQDRPRWRPYDDDLARDRSVVPAAGMDAHARWWRDAADRPAPPPGLVLAGFGQRLAAYAVDMVIVGVLAAGGVAAIWIGAVSQDRPLLLTGATAAATFGVVTCLPVVYEAVGVGLYGRTPGKAVLGLRVVRPDGTVPIGVALACVRILGRMASGAILYIGFLMALWDDERRTLHDTMADTRVVRMPASTLHAESRRPGGITVTIAALLGVVVLCMLGVWALVPAGGVDLRAVADGSLLRPPPLHGEIEPDPGGFFGEGLDVSVYDLSVNACFVTGGADVVTNVVAVPCGAPHDAQLYAVEDLRGAETLDGGLSDRALASVAQQVCMQRADAVVEAQPMLEVVYLHPTVETWQRGDRETRCVIVSVGGPVSRSLVAPDV